MAKQRLDKIVASTGRWSRKEVKQLVKMGRVAVNGIPAASPEDKADPETEQISVNGEVLDYREYTWIMLHKPAGYLSATEDGHGATVLDLLPDELKRRKLFPVGRLDKDTEGLLLLTNEGELAHSLLSPKYHVDKVYFARVQGLLTQEDCAFMESGPVLADGLHCLPAELRILTAGEESEGLITVREGKFHQVKRMFADRGKPVLYLKRVKMGNLPLDPVLEKGEYRFLTTDEEKSLRSVVQGGNKK